MVMLFLEVFPPKKLNLRWVVKQSLRQVREHVIHFFPTSMLNDRPSGFDDRNPYPSVLMSNCQHEGLNETLGLHVKVLWRERREKDCSPFNCLTESWIMQWYNTQLMIHYQTKYSAVRSICTNPDLFPLFWILVKLGCFRSSNKF